LLSKILIIDIILASCEKKMSLTKL